jgi:hypothetical protein
MNYGINAVGMKKFVTTLLILTVFTGCPAFAQEPGQSRIPTVTRLVKQFSELENKLLALQHKKDIVAMQKLLADDFEMRVGAMPGNPIPRMEWLQSTKADAANLPTAEQMAVHDYGKFVVVSFLGKRTSSGNLFIVDVWSHNNSEWRLSTRYASPAGETTFDIPGMSAGQPVIKKKY